MALKDYVGNPTRYLALKVLLRVKRDFCGSSPSLQRQADFFLNSSQCDRWCELAEIDANKYRWAVMTAPKKKEKEVHRASKKKQLSLFRD